MFATTMFSMFALDRIDSMVFSVRLSAFISLVIVSLGIFETMSIRSSCSYRRRCPVLSSRRLFVFSFVWFPVWQSVSPVAAAGTLSVSELAANGAVELPKTKTPSLV